MSTILTIRVPKRAEKRQSFSLLQINRQNGKQTCKSLKSPELTKINADYKGGILAYEEAFALVSDLRKKMVAKEGGLKPITHAENQKLLSSYWKQDYQFRDVVDSNTMWHDLNRALRVIGNLSLYTCDQTELQAKIQKSGLPPNRRRRVILRLNQLLRFAGRGFKLKLPRKEFLEVKYLTADEVRRLADKLGGLNGHLVTLAFATGCRQGELFAITEANDRIIYINSQIKRDGKRTQTKTRNSRKIRMLPYGDKALKVWLSIPISQRPRGRQYSAIVKAACKRLWKNNPEKHITFHDLRHSFAIEMLRLGESFDTIAQLLGDSVAVCQAYYTGFSMADQSLDALDERLKKAFKLRG